jgi:hypothetical protein
VACFDRHHQRVWIDVAYIDRHCAGTALDVACFERLHAGVTAITAGHPFDAGCFECQSEWIEDRVLSYLQQRNKACLLKVPVRAEGIGDALLFHE